MGYGQPFFGQPFYGQPFYGQPAVPPTDPNFNYGTDPTVYYPNERSYLQDRPQFGAPVRGAITGIKMPSENAFELHSRYPMAYFPVDAAIHPPADDGHVDTFYHTHDHTHLTDDSPSFNPSHPFILPSVSGHPDVVQEHTDAFQHGHIHFHIVAGTDPCRGDDSDDDDDCYDIEEYVERVASEITPFVPPQPVFQQPVATMDTTTMDTTYVEPFGDGNPSRLSDEGCKSSSFFVSCPIYVKSTKAFMNALMTLGWVHRATST